MADKNDKKLKKTSIGGQAVLEGVMMKGERSIATAVRTEAGEITVESKRVKSVKEKNLFFRLPFVRGVTNLCSQLFQGTGILLRSAEVYGDFAEPSKSDKWIAEKLKINPMSILMGFSVVLGILLAIGMFVFLPNFLTGLIFKIPELAESPLQSLWYSLIEGGIMLIIFISYVLIVSLMKDIRRVFMYHGAEHKVISCYEHGLDLTIENARTMSTKHSRCGTTFMFFVVMISILVFALINWALESLGWLTDNSIINALIRFPCKLLFVPVVAGISYELLKLLAKSDALPVRILRAPGMWLQKLTTRQPTDDMLEVSITAFKTVLALDSDETLPTSSFEIKIPYEKARKAIVELAPSAEESDVDWIFVEVTGKKRSELCLIENLSGEQYKSALKIAQKMKDGMPLQYALGNTEFYGIRLSVNPNVLIPRSETELTVEKAIAFLKARSEVEKAEKQTAGEAPMYADVCTGSGAIAIAVAKNVACKAYATDISPRAIQIATANALVSATKVKCKVGDLFEPLKDMKFDLITINPPYIPSADIEGLDLNVSFEPRLALDGGEDGLDFYRRIAAEVEPYLKYDGALIMEIGIGQSEEIKKIFGAFDLEIATDLEGIPRIVTAVKRK